MINRIHIIIAAILVAAALLALIHLAMLDEPAAAEEPEPTFPVLRLQKAPATIEPAPSTGPPEPSAAPPQWDWTVDGRSFALDPETGEVAIPDGWLDTGCGCTDPALANWQPFTYHERIPLSEDLQCVLWNACQEYGIPYEIGLALIETESGFNPDADNGICRGLCALHRLYWPEVLPPGENIQEGMRLLARHYEAYGDWGAALCAYNVGHDNGDRYYSSIILERAAKWGEIANAT